MTPQPVQNDHVVVCIPYYKCQKYIRRAVLSILNQTHRNLTVAVVNDADFNTPPWPVLADITDPRLVRYDLMENKGPFFITQLVLNVTRSPYFLIQDSDDWSHPQRVAYLLMAVKHERSDLAISAQPQIMAEANGRQSLAEIRWLEKKHGTGTEAGSRFKINTKINSDLRYRSPHHGLFKTDTLQKIGGYHPGYRINYDSLVPNLILMTGKISHVPVPLYYRFVRGESLTHSRETGVKSAAAAREQQMSKMLYNVCYENYQKHLKGHFGKDALLSSFRHTLKSTVDHATRKSLIGETARFGSLIGAL